jgi:drug/metabolite transporter (DMT)-like permease
MGTTGIGLLLAAVCALAWSGVDALRKALGQRIGAVTAAGAIQFGAALPFLAMLPLQPPVQPLGEEFWLALAGSIVLNTVANIVYVRAIQISPLALTIPYLGFSPVFLLVGGALLFGERPTWISALGVLVVVVGAVLLNPGTGGHGFHPINAIRRERGSALMLLVALLWSLATLLDRVGLRHSGVTLYATLVNAGVGLPLVAFATLRRPHDMAATRNAWVLVTATIAVLSLAMATQMLSWKYLFVAYQDVMKRAGGIVFSPFIGWLFFSEKGLRKRLPAVLLMSAGVTVVLLGRE